MIFQRFDNPCPGRSRCVAMSAALLALFTGLHVLAAAEDPLPGWRHALYCRKAEGNVHLLSRWYPSQGVRLTVVERETGRTIAMGLNRDGLSTYDPLKGPQATLEYQTQFYPSQKLLEPEGQVSTIVKIRENEWTFYVDGVLTARMPAPFQPPADIYLPAEDRADIGEPPVFRSVPREQFVSDFMIEEGAPNQLYPWRIEAGTWRIHTAMQDALNRPESDLARMEKVPLTADKSPNFYSLKAGGKDPESAAVAESVITTGYDFFDDYDLRAAVQLDRGEAGLVFYHQGEGRRNFYAFTIHMGTYEGAPRYVRLWRVKDGRQHELARADVPLFDRQWYAPAVRLHTDEIICYLDGVEVIRVEERLPPGGKIGLYAKAEDDVRFDDVALEGFQRLPLRTVGEVRYHTLFQNGTFFRERSFWRLGTPLEQTWLKPDPRPDEQTLVVGRAHNTGTVFSADFVPGAEPWSLGLVCGFRSPAEPYFRFVVERRDGVESYRLERLTQGRAQLIDQWQHPAPAAGATGTVSLMADATENGKLRLLEGGDVVLLIPLDGTLRGAAGPYVGPGTDTQVARMTYEFERNRFLEAENKNPVFQEDSFMRHWASPEGQWIGGEDDLLWHKGDFFSDFSVRLPCIDGSVFHAFVPDGSQDGPVRVSVKDARIALQVDSPAGGDPLTYEHALTPPEGKSVSTMDYEFHREGYWVWVTLDGEMIMRHRIPVRYAGTRCRVKGMTLANLARSRVTRSNVIADFFTESPYRWIVNGGNWQIINRFQCTPSWSHMIGESADSMAALWYKRVFSGDLTLEFYAGTRHGWYERAGDLNCTVMADTTSPNAGYTVTATEYDYNLSQNWSTLYREGQVVDRSDKYLIPRRRAGMVRKFLNPLVSKGRPIHGAWYYIKLRRIGNKLEYYFDNELVFSLTDDDAIEEGLVGIWTFMHSMTLAQVKIAFQNSEPRQFPVQRLPIAPDPPPPDETQTGQPQWAITDRGFPLDSLDPAYWSSDDEVGQATLTPFTMNAAGLRLTNRLGAGDMALQPDLPLVPLNQLAGWRFLMKRTPGARINLHYSIGTVNGKGEFIPRQRCFEQLSGAGFTDGDYECTGTSEVPPCDNVELPGGDWEEVTAWIPSRLRSAADKAKGWMVRLDGFGNRQPNPILCGLGGNEPNDAYSVRQLTPICYGIPDLTTGDGTALRFALRSRPNGRLYGETLGEEALADLNDLIESVSDEGLNQAWIRVLDQRGKSLHHNLAWVVLPEAMPVTVDWDPDHDETLRITHQAPYPDPRMAELAIAVAGKNLPVSPLGNHEVLLARLTRGESLPSATLDVRVTRKNAPITHATLAWHDRPVNHGPVLTGMTGLGHSVTAFEDSDTAPLQFARDGRMDVLYDDPVQGRFVQVQNTALNQRMAASFSLPVSVAEYPIMQLRYRAFDMTHLTVAYKNYHYVRLNDDYSAAAKVRLAHDLKLDGTWHTWTGFVSDAFTRQPYAADRFNPRSFAIRSCGNPDQTGRYSRWHMDDLVFGRAVRTPDQLACTPTYLDPDGVRAVAFAVLEGPEPYHDRPLSEMQTLSWTAAEPGTPVNPRFDGLADGVHHLVIRATDSRDATSAVFDYPFLLDRKPLDVTAAIGAYSDPASNGTQLTVTMNNHGGAPWAIEKAVFSIDGKKKPLPSWTNLYSHSAGAEKLILNYPFLFRKQLDAAKNGDTFQFSIDGIVDGAGNSSPTLNVPVKVDYDKDKTGPAWYSMKFDSSVNWWWNWDGYRNNTAALNPAQHNQVDVVHKAGSSPFLQHLTYRNAGDLTKSVNWKPAVHPWLSFRANQPAYNPKRGVMFRVVLTTTDKRTYTLSLTNPGRGGSELNRGRTIQWKRNEWQRLSFNVAEMLRQAGVSAEVLAKTTVNSINFQRRGTRHQEPLHLDDVFLHGTATDTGKPDPLTVHAYDASGVAGLKVECVDDNDKVQWTEDAPNEPLDLETLRSKIKTAAWLRCRAKDHAGNLSVPFWIPLAANEPAVDIAENTK